MTISKKFLDSVNYIIDLLILASKKEQMQKFEVISEFDTLKTALAEAKKNDFFQDILIHSVYSTVRKKTYFLDDILNNEHFLTFLNEYKPFSTNFEIKNKEKIDKIIKIMSSVPEFKNVENQVELLSYTLKEAFIYYQDADLSYISKINGKTSKINTSIYSEILNASSDQDIIKQLNDKNIGFYLFNSRIGKTLTPSRYLRGITLVSNQTDGITIYRMKSIITDIIGITCGMFQTTTLTSKNHSIPVKLHKSDSKDISIDNKKLSDFEKLPLVNKLIIKNLISLVTNKEEVKKIKKENKVLVHNKSLKTSEINLPIVSNFEYEKMKDFSFDELRFSGKYDFLSPLDDIFKDFIDMDMVNLKTDKQHCYYELTQKLNKWCSPAFKAENFNPEEFYQSYSIHEYGYDQLPLGTQRSISMITAKDETIVGSKEDVYKKLKEISKMNKLSILSVLFDFHESFFFKDFKDSLDKCINENMPNLINDELFLDLINSFGMADNIKKNYNKLHVSGGHENYKKDYLNKNNAKTILTISIHNNKTIDYLIKNYNLTLSERSKEIVIIEGIKEKLLKMLSNDPNKKLRNNFFSYWTNDLDVELHRWFFKSSFGIFNIPMSNKQTKLFREKLEKIKGEDIIQNCSEDGGQNFRNLSLVY